jgi:hypothetical protein
MKIYRIVISILVAVVAGLGQSAQAQSLNDKLMNRPYADMHLWHLGFSVGLHTQNLSFTHNGYVTEDGEAWFVEQPSYSPGFSVTGLADLRLNTYFNLRLSPGMLFGNRDLRMRESNSGSVLRQNIKTAYLVLPLDLKFSALRYRNSRPYMTAGVMPAFNLTRKSGDYLRLKSSDVYLTVGFGCDFYLPYFKLNPEIKFCFGLTDVLQHDRPDLTDDPDKLKIGQSLTKAASTMLILSFYFE